MDTYRKCGVKIKTFPAVKDETDTELAAQAVIEAGADEVVLRCTRQQMGSFLCECNGAGKAGKTGIDAMILHSHNKIMVSNHTLHLNDKPGSFVSLLPLGDNVVIHKTIGFKVQD